ncbi:MAG TPA: hypothetical protein VF221_11250 [Chloroflexota bacterium]
MSSPVEQFAFVDSVHASEFLHVTQDTVLDWIAAGRLRAFGGKPSNPFLRSADVVALAQELGVQEDEGPRRTKSPSSKVQTRLTADARWADVNHDDIREWTARADDVRRAAARKAVEVARSRLDLLLAELDAVEKQGTAR